MQNLKETSWFVVEQHHQRVSRSTGTERRDQQRHHHVTDSHLHSWDAFLDFFCCLVLQCGGGGEGGFLPSASSPAGERGSGLGHDPTRTEPLPLPGAPVLALCLAAEPRIPPAVPPSSFQLAVKVFRSTSEPVWTGAKFTQRPAERFWPPFEKNPIQADGRFFRMQPEKGRTGAETTRELTRSEKGSVLIWPWPRPDFSSPAGEGSKGQNPPPRPPDPTAASRSREAAPQREEMRVWCRQRVTGWIS